MKKGVLTTLSEAMEQSSHDGNLWHTTTLKKELN